MDENIPCKFFRNHSSTFPHIVLQTYAFDFIRVDVALAHESFIGSLNRYRYHWHAKGDVSRALAETILMADLNPLLAEELPSALISKVVAVLTTEDFVVTRPRTATLLRGRWARGSKSPERSVSYSS